MLPSLPRPMPAAARCATPGFKDADTVARLLVDEKLQQQIAGQLIWIDEAGLLGMKTMSHVFALAEKLDARVLLSGDRHQHGSVERGAALRLLEEEAGLVPAEVKEIQRQSGDYKEAVKALAEGDAAEGFQAARRSAWVTEIPSDERYIANGRRLRRAVKRRQNSPGRLADARRRGPHHRRNPPRPARPRQARRATNEHSPCWKAPTSPKPSGATRSIMPRATCWCSIRTPRALPAASG